MKNAHSVESYKHQVNEYANIYGIECFFDGTITFEQLAIMYQDADCSCGLSLEEATAIIENEIVCIKESQEVWS